MKLKDVVTWAALIALLWQVSSSAAADQSAGGCGCASAGGDVPWWQGGGRPYTWEG